VFELLFIAARTIRAASPPKILFPPHKIKEINLVFTLVEHCYSIFLYHGAKELISPLKHRLLNSN